MILSSILFPLLSIAQVTIKEKVEIKPRVKLPSTAAVELKIAFHWAAAHSGGQDYLMHLGVLAPGNRFFGFNAFTGSQAGNYTELITDDDGIAYYGESTYIDPNPYSGPYIFYAYVDRDTKFITYYYYYRVHIQAEGIVDTTIYFPNKQWDPMYDRPFISNEIYYTYHGTPAGPCSGASFVFSEIQDVQHGETRTLHAPILDDCGNNVDPPPEYYYKYELLGDTLSWGVLRDPNTRRMGTVLDSVASTIVEYCAWGKEPDCQKELTVRVSAENGSITPATTTFTVLPPEARLMLGKSTLSFGDTTLATVQVRYPGSEWMDRPDDWRTRFGIVQADTFGHLYLIDSSQTGSYIDAWESNVIYYAHPQSEADSLDVLIQVVSHEPSGGGDTRIELIDHPNANSLQLERATKAPQPKVVAGTGKGNPGLTSIRYNYATHYGLARLVLKKNEILLGETKYYQAKPDPNNNAGLIFVEMSETSSWVAGGQPAQFTVTAEKPTNKLGVYYEFRDNDALKLAGDMIRLIGRYWRQDTTYKVRLNATSGTRSGSIVIEVKKPTRLHDSEVFPKPFKTTENIRGLPLDIDELCIRYGGSIGIPPQVIKGQMFQEGDKSGDRINPSYRYEPWQDSRFANQANRENALAYAQQPFWVTGKPPKPMGLGKAIPAQHTPDEHKNVMPIYYPETSTTIAEFALGHWEKIYWNSKDYKIPGSAELTRIWRERFLRYFVQALTVRTSPPVANPDQLATFSVKQYVRDNYTALAQTRKAASYGLVQIIYTTAIMPMLGFNKGKSVDASSSPEELSDETIEMPFYESFTEKNLRRVFGDKNAIVPEGDWAKGWEGTWKESFKPYNDDPPYAKSVFNHAKKFYPQAK